MTEPTDNKDLCVTCGQVIEKYVTVRHFLFGEHTVQRDKCVHCGLAESCRSSRLLPRPYQEPKWRLTKDGKAPEAYIKWHREKFEVHPETEKEAT